jgi:hypothetical protein
LFSAVSPAAKPLGEACSLLFLLQPAYHDFLRARHASRNDDQDSATGHKKKPICLPKVEFMAHNQERATLRENFSLRMLYKGAKGNNAKSCHVRLSMERKVWLALAKDKLPAFKELQAGGPA